MNGAMEEKYKYFNPAGMKYIPFWLLCFILARWNYLYFPSVAPFVGPDGVFIPLPVGTNCSYICAVTLQGAV